jgi:hypothetical protein
MEAETPTTTETPTTALPPSVGFELVAWTIEFRPLEGVQSISMIANVGPLTVEEVQGIGGSLIWNETEVRLCTNLNVVGGGGFIGIREVYDGFLEIGDAFGSDETGAGCNIGMQEAFSDFGLPQNACLYVTAGDVDNQFCAPLRVVRTGAR